MTLEKRTVVKPTNPSFIVFVLNFNFSPVVVHRFDQPVKPIGFAEIKQTTNDSKYPGCIEYVVRLFDCN